MMIGRLSLTSPLLRRIQRHSSFATLFRDAALSNPNANHAPGSSQLLPLVGVDAPTVGVLHILPYSHLAPAVPSLAPNPAGQQPQATDVVSRLNDWPMAAPLGQPAAALQRQPAAPITQAAPTAVVATLPLTTATQPGSPIAAPTTPATPTTEKTLDQDWSRLQKIYRLHEEQTAADTRPDEQTAVSMVQHTVAPAGQVTDPDPRAVQARPNSGERRRPTVSYVTDRRTESRPMNGPAHTPPATRSFTATPRSQAPTPPVTTSPTATMPSFVQRVPESARDLVHATTSMDAFPAETEPPTGPGPALNVQPTTQTPDKFGHPAPAPTQARTMAAQPAIPENATGIQTKQSAAQPIAAQVMAPSEAPAPVHVAGQQLGEPIQQTPLLPQPHVIPEVANGPYHGEAGAAVAPAMQALSAGDEPEVQLNPLPLEAVWSVQRQGVSIATAAATNEDEPAAASIRELPAAERAVIARALGQVATEQPTASAVELALPRRPRPPQPPRSPTRLAAGPMSTTNPALTADQEIGPLLQRQLANATQPAQEQARAGASAQEANQLVPTEIGALPRDLWQLLGEQPPSTPAAINSPGGSVETPTSLPELQRAPLAPQAHPAVLQRSEAAAGAPQGQLASITPYVEARKTATVALPAPAARLTPPAFVHSAPTVQPQTDTLARPTPDRPAVAAFAAVPLSPPQMLQRQMNLSALPVLENDDNVTPPAANATAPTAIDIDALARAVYTQLKQRLHLERERMRR